MARFKRLLRKCSKSKALVMLVSIALVKGLPQQGLRRDRTQLKAFF